MSKREPLLPAEGILRTGDMLVLWRDDTEIGLVLNVPENVGYPLPALFFPVGYVDDVPHEYTIPADFGERAARSGRISAADAWSVWTENV